MKAEFKPITREYFEEYYYVVTNLRKFIKKPSRRVKFVTRHLIPYIIYAGIFLVTTVAFALYDAQYLGFVPIPAIAFIVILFSFFVASSKIRKSGQAGFTLTFTSTKKIASIALENGDKLELDWADVKQIIVAEYTIIFIPKTPEHIPLAIPADGLKKLQATLKEYKLSGLLK